jgi:hypothetical protein
LVREARPVELPAAVTQAIEKLARAHGRKAPSVLQSAGVGGPAVVGALRPVVLIPEDLPMAPEDLRAALLHETAHVLRHDYAVNLACEVLTLPVCWHPALIAIKAGVGRSRELACDAIAAAAMASPKTYAKCLVSLAQTLGAPAAPAALAVGLFGRSDLEDRLMHLMQPRDAEAPAVRAARLCGLAAVGASLLGSAALLHVTPVFAQAAPAAPIAARPAVAATPAIAATPATPATAATPATPARHRQHLIYSRHGVIIEDGDSGYRHSFTASDGRKLTVVNDDPAEPTLDQQRAWEADARQAEAQAAAAEKMVNSSEFKARIAKAQARAADVEKMVNSPEFKARIAKAQARAADVEKMVNSPEFKARIAKAQAHAADVEKMVNSPEFKARIAEAAARAADVEKMVNSPEFQARIARAQAAAEAFSETAVQP